MSKPWSKKCGGCKKKRCDCKKKCDVLCVNGCKYLNFLQKRFFETLRVAATLQYPPYIFQDQFGQFQGFDYELVRRIATLIPCIRTLEIVNYTDPELGFDQALNDVRLGIVDIFPESDISYIRQRALSGLSFLITDTNTSTQAVLFYTGSLTGVLGPVPDPATALAQILAAAGDPKVIAPGAGTIQSDTLIAAGFPDDRIVNVANAVATDNAQVSQLMSDNGAEAFLSALTENDDLSAFTSDPNFRFGVVNLDPNLVTLGSGWVLNRTNCKLNLWVQFLFDKLLKKGFVQQLKTKYSVMDGNPTPVSSISLPTTKGYSFEIGAMSRNCIYDCLLPCPEKACEHDLEVTLVEESS